MTQIGYLGAGTWGVSLAAILAQNGHRVVMWVRDAALRTTLEMTRVHPKLLHPPLPASVQFVHQLEAAVFGADLLVESVTSQGVRSVFTAIGATPLPVIVTSKGIERGSGLLLPEIVAELVGHRHIGCLSGPSHAEEVIRGLPTSVVCSGYEETVIQQVKELFTTPTFRVYPNGDLAGVAFGGALKNIIAIACGISDGLGSGDNAKAVLMTRGLHEIRKLSLVKGCHPDTLNGLSGMGDLCVTCLSTHSRNYRFGRLIAEGFSLEGAKQKIGMAVEGIYSCRAAYELGGRHGVAVPITEAIYSILYSGLSPREAVQRLLQRAVKEEHL